MDESCRWSRRTLRDESVEVDRGDGNGFVRPKFGELPQLERTWRWRSLAEQKSAKYGVPAPWILAITAIESGGDDKADNAPLCGGTGCVGLMAVHWAVHGQSREDMLDAEKNMDYGTSLLARSRDKGFDFPQAASIHVAGGGATWAPHSDQCGECKRHGFCPWGMCEHKGYIERGVKALNYFVDKLALQPRPPNGARPPEPLRAGLFGTLLPFGAGMIVGYFAIEFVVDGLIGRAKSS